MLRKTHCWSDLKPKVNAYITPFGRNIGILIWQTSSMKYSPTWERTSTKEPQRDFYSGSEQGAVVPCGGNAVGVTSCTTSAQKHPQPQRDFYSGSEQGAVVPCGRNAVGVTSCTTVRDFQDLRPVCVENE
ncbi:hypothetical protein PoB_001473300 [Plakobranchus ocellatus]|uniref:Uncharacterized protein n=1 Tax=Plakobranchus ocellatus TaxID=259542 RepID=A0AAV3Z0U1_9GAST|nr:hypothetical protein PoB_001473300 [Plakobranchus ocellatus]